MSIFSHIKKSRQQAKDHNAKFADQKSRETQGQPYRHVPTHAAIDAIASAPPSWRDDDRHKIKEQNRRRHELMVSGHHMSMPGLPRTGSQLSNVSYPSGDASPVVQVPPSHSYTNYPSPRLPSQKQVSSISDSTHHTSYPNGAKDAQHYSVVHQPHLAHKVVGQDPPGQSSPSREAAPGQPPRRFSAGCSASAHSSPKLRRLSEHPAHRSKISSRTFRSPSSRLPPTHTQAGALVHATYDKNCGTLQPVTHGPYGIASRQSSAATLPSLASTSSRAGNSAPLTPSFPATVPPPSSQSYTFEHFPDLDHITAGDERVYSHQGRSQPREPLKEFRSTLRSPQSTELDTMELRRQTALLG